MRERDMIALGFDTSGPYCAVALCKNGHLIASAKEDMARGQAERLMSLVDQTLTHADVDRRDLNAVGVGIGPGNFTGIRISVAAARGLALGLDIPAIGVSAFDVIAHIRGTNGTPVVPAPRNQLYVAATGQMSALMSEEAAAIHAPLIYPETTVNPAEAIAELAALRAGADHPRPAPLYIKPADAAPARDAPPRIVP